MRAFVLFLLILVLGLLIFLKIEMDEARKVSNEVTSDFIKEEYTITKVDSSGYFGESDGKNIYFKKEKVPVDTQIQAGDQVRLHFVKNGRIDGPVKIEKIE